MSDRQVSNLVRQNLYAGYSKEETFTNVCRELNWKSLPTKKIKKMFEGFYESSDYYRRNRRLKHHHDLFKKIAEEFQLKKSRRLTTFSARNIQTFKLWNCRYAIVTMIGERGFDSVLLIDNFYGEHRDHLLQNPRMFKGGWCLGSEIIDSERVLFIFKDATNEEDNHFTIYLIYIDFDKNECKFVDANTITGQFYEIIFDCNDRRQFVLRFLQESRIQYQLGSVDGKEILLEERRMESTARKNFSYLRYKSGKLEGLTFDYADTAFGILKPLVFCELVMFPREGHTRFGQLFDVQIESAIHRVKYSPFCYIWSKNVCYLIQRGDSDELKQETFGVWKFDPFELIQLTMNFNALSMKTVSRLILIDLFHICTKRLTPTDFYGIGHPLDVCIDEDNLLTVCVKNTDQIGFITFLLRGPDRLDNLAFFAVRKHFLSNKDRSYASLVNALPNNWQPLRFPEPDLSSLTIYGQKRVAMGVFFDLPGAILTLAILTEMAAILYVVYRQKNSVQEGANNIWNRIIDFCSGWW